MSTNGLKLFSDLGDLINYLIDIDGLNKSKFSDKIRADKSQVTKWTTKKLIPGRESLHKIEEAFGIKIAKTGDKWTFIDPKLGFRAIVNDLPPPDLGKKPITGVVNEEQNQYLIETRPARSAQRIQKSRERAGYSHEDLAEKLGVHRTTIGKWESNKAQPSIDNYERMGEILNTSPTFLMAVDHYPPDVQSDYILARRNLTDLRARLTQLQAQGNLSENDFDILHAAIGILGRLLRHSDS